MLKEPNPKFIRAAETQGYRLVKPTYRQDILDTRLGLVAKRNLSNVSQGAVLLRRAGGTHVVTTSAENFPPLLDTAFVQAGEAVAGARTLAVPLHEGQPLAVADYLVHPVTDISTGTISKIVEAQRRPLAGMESDHELPPAQNIVGLVDVTDQQAITLGAVNLAEREIFAFSVLEK